MLSLAGAEKQEFETDLCSNLVVWPSITVLELYIRLLMHTIQVFMKPIQQEGQKLLGVLLLEAIKSRCVLCYRPLQKGFTK